MPTIFAIILSSFYLFSFTFYEKEATPYETKKKTLWHKEKKTPYDTKKKKRCW